MNKYARKNKNYMVWTRCDKQPSHGRFVVWKNACGYIETFYPNVDPNTLNMNELLGGITLEAW